MHILRTKTVMVKVENRSMIAWYIPYNMFKRELIQKLAKLSDLNSDARRNIFLINRNRIVEKTGISSHQSLQKQTHLRIRKVDIIQLTSVYTHLNFGGYINIL